MINVVCTPSQISQSSYSFIHRNFAISDRARGRRHHHRDAKSRRIGAGPVATVGGHAYHPRMRDDGIDDATSVCGKSTIAQDGC